MTPTTTSSCSGAAGCQFTGSLLLLPRHRGGICKRGHGPKSIAKKMIDKLYKYSSDRAQFSLIPAKTMSVSVGQLTIHNHLWQPKRPSAPRRHRLANDPVRRVCGTSRVVCHFLPFGYEVCRITDLFKRLLDDKTKPLPAPGTRMAGGAGGGLGPIGPSGRPVPAAWRLPTRCVPELPAAGSFT